MSRCKCCNVRLEAFDDFILCKKCIRKSEDTSTTWKDPQHILITNVRSGSMRDGGVISPQRKGCD